MQEIYSLVVGDEVYDLNFSDNMINELCFVLENNQQLHFYGANDDLLKHLVYAITNQPRNLLAHLQRIILCYEKNNEMQLSAALMDFFIVLEGRGSAIKQRMLTGARKHLSPSLFEQLQAYLDVEQIIQGNMYSVLISGRESNHELILLQVSEGDKNDSHDSLQIARDFVEYSQLEEAVSVLESAIIETPQRSELHVDLIELYKSTGDRVGFGKMQLALANINHPMQQQWDALSSYFNQ